MFKQQKSQSGQILLITLLIMSIATTVALSLVSRTTTDVNISSQLEESSRAFNAAEAGIELALKGASGSTGAIGASDNYNVTVTGVGATQTYTLPNKTQAGTTETIWLVDHNASGVPVIATTYTKDTIDVCWSGETITPAVIITVLYRKLSVYYTAKIAIDPLAARRNGTAPYSPANNFSAPTATSNGCGVSTMYKKTIQLKNPGSELGSSPPNPSANPLIMLRVRPVYSDTTIAVQGAAGSTLPKQGNTIVSTGTSQSGTTRKIIVNQSYRAPSTIFDSVVFSQQSFGH